MAVITVVSENGDEHLLLCLLDQGNQSSFITEAVTQSLKLKRTPIMATVSGLASVTAETSKHLVSFNKKTRYDTEFELPLESLVLSKITGHLPSSFKYFKSFNRLGSSERVVSSRSALWSTEQN